jgi:hypothetical protein
LAFALVDSDDHSLAIDVFSSKTYHFGDAQARRVAGGQDRAVLGDCEIGQTSVGMTTSDFYGPRRPPRSSQLVDLLILIINRSSLILNVLP